MTEMNHATRMVICWFDESFRHDGVDSVREHITEELDQIVEKIPNWVVDVCGINFTADNAIDWDRLVDIYGRTPEEAKWLHG